MTTAGYLHILWLELKGSPDKYGGACLCIAVVRVPKSPSAFIFVPFHCILASFWPHFAKVIHKNMRCGHRRSVKLRSQGMRFLSLQEQWSFASHMREISLTLDPLQLPSIWRRQMFGADPATKGRWSTAALFFPADRADLLIRYDIKLNLN